MGGGGGHAPHDVPDWKIYKAEGIPQLDRLQRRLGALGLKDPWIRNEVWRFQPSGKGPTPWGIIALRKTFRGLGIAVAALAITIMFDKLTNKGKANHHEHSHH